jgi:hypothetical protein
MRDCKCFLLISKRFETLDPVQYKRIIAKKTLAWVTGSL